MPASDVETYNATAKEMFPPDQMEEQFYGGHEMLSQLEKQKPLEVSSRGAITTILLGTGGGVSMIPMTGSNSLNKPAGPQVDKATWKLGRVRKAVEFDTAVNKLANGEPKTVANMVDLNVTSSLSAMQAQLTRQLFSDGSGIVCQCATSTTTNTIKLATTGGSYALGREVIRNAWLQEGQQIDIGTLASESSIADGVEVTGYNDNEAEPTITISGAAVTTSGSHYVSLRNARVGETSSYEIHGVRQFAGEGELGDIDPAEVPQWKGAFLDTSGGALTRNRVIAGRRKVKTRNGTKEAPDWAFTSPEQIELLENETFQQVRFDDPGKQNLGEGETAKIGSLTINGMTECPIGDFTYSIKKYIFALREGEPYWVNEAVGGGGRFVTQPGSTFIYGDMEYFLQICLTKRKSIGQFQNLEA